MFASYFELFGWLYYSYFIGRLGYSSLINLPAEISRSERALDTYKEMDRYSISDLAASGLSDQDVYNWFMAKSMVWHMANGWKGQFVYEYKTRYGNVYGEGPNH